MDLFLDNKKLTFEKLGMEARMSEDPNEWPEQILDQLYRQAPYASDYSPKIVLDDVDADRRYAMGRIELINQLAINPRDDSTPAELRGKQKVVLPVVIKDGKLSPIDLLMHSGEVEPLTEERLRQALFRPALFEAIRQRPGDMSMIEQLYPPNRQYGGARGPLVADAGSGMVGTTRTASINKEALSHVTTDQWNAIYDDPKLKNQISSLQKKYKVTNYDHPSIDNLVISEAVKRHGYQKLSSAKPEFLLDAIMPTVKKAHVQHVAQQIGEDPVLRSALFSNDTVIPFMAKLAEVESIEKDPASYLKKVAGSIKPNVVQVQKIQGGFRIKTANSDALIPTADDVDRPSAVGTLGADMVSSVERDGTTTISTNPAVKETMEDVTIKVVTEFGIFKVKKVGDNAELIGWVFPKVMDFTGEVLPMAVFSNGSESSMQENIAGIPVARQTDILSSHPQGMGCFYYATSSGAQALVPVMVKSEVETPEGVSYVCETVLGEQCTVVKVPGLKAVQEIAEGRYGIPEECSFMPLVNVVDLAASPDEFAKTAEAQAVGTTAVRIITDGSVYSFEGMPIDKLAGVMDTKFLNKDDAVFLGSILGHEPTKLAHALSTMRSEGHQELWFHARPVTPLRDKYAAAEASARQLLNKLPNLRADLLKEAAPIEDPAAVDKILSVGFLNPENVSIFASYAPEIEDTIKKLSELLMATRMGLGSVEEGALQKAIVHLDKVVAGLKTIGSMPKA